MKFTSLARAPVQDVIELSGEVVHNIQSGMSELPLSLLTQTVRPIVFVAPVRQKPAHQRDKKGLRALKQKHTYGAVPSMK